MVRAPSTQHDDGAARKPWSLLLKSLEQNESEAAGAGAGVGLRLQVQGQVQMAFPGGNLKKQLGNEMGEKGQRSQEGSGVHEQQHEPGTLCPVRCIYTHLSSCPSGGHRMFVYSSYHYPKLVNQDINTPKLVPNPPTHTSPGGCQDFGETSLGHW